MSSVATREGTQGTGRGSRGATPVTVRASAHTPTSRRITDTGRQYGRRRIPTRHTAVSSRTDRPSEAALTVLASIPSPPANTFELGPLEIHWYGVLIGLGVVAAAVITVKRYERFGGDPTGLDAVLTWVVLLGFAGARLAYVSTHLDRYEGRPWAVLFVWEGGLALFGGITAGALTAVVLLRRRGYDVWRFADAVAVGLPVAQAIGRWGNYVNQELFGTPSDLPWAVEIDPANRPAAFADAATFHPTFLYESLWNLLVVVPAILVLERRGLLPKGAAIGVYLVLYGVIRFLTELLRTDTTFRLLGLSRNGWVSLLAIGVGIGVVVWRRRTVSAATAR
ncbi:MAG: prolipoprotein diacylglyceryl transferase [Acidimicrobiia bacterium]|nr:prolipoprotein diacylglyceryl transferase [Acidimicrobiia bacterium]